jgi:hypothetical protein
MPKSRSKRNRYQPPPAPRPRPSPPWYAPLIVVLLLVGFAWIILFYMNLLPFGLQDRFNNYNLLFGFAPMLAGLLLATRWV